jgi:hypothetical protein
MKNGKITKSVPTKRLNKTNLKKILISVNQNNPFFVLIWVRTIKLC